MQRRHAVPGYFSNDPPNPEPSSPPLTNPTPLPPRIQRQPCQNLSATHPVADAHLHTVAARQSSHGGRHVRSTTTVPEGPCERSIIFCIVGACFA